MYDQKALLRMNGICAELKRHDAVRMQLVLSR